jgi:hypothetical protein
MSENLNNTGRFDLRRLRNPGPPHRDALIGLMVVRNEVLRIQKTLDHHRKLGINYFVIIDNNSNDGTLEHLMNQSDVELWSTDSPFGQSNCGLIWLSKIVSRYGYLRWYLHIDADEHLVYPGMEDINLHKLTRIMMADGVYALRSVMIDMYPKGPIKDIDVKSDDDLLDLCPYFDGDSYRSSRLTDGAYVVRGGARQRLIKSRQEDFTISMEKYPLRIWQKGCEVINIHRSPYPVQRIPPTSALLHFKFIGDFGKKIEIAIDEKQHWQEAKEYKIYKENYDILENPFYEGSVKYNDPNTLISKGIIHDFHWR